MTVRANLVNYVNTMRGGVATAMNDATNGVINTLVNVSMAVGSVREAAINGLLQIRNDVGWIPFGIGEWTVDRLISMVATIENAVLSVPGTINGWLYSQLDHSYSMYVWSRQAYFALGGLIPFAEVTGDFLDNAINDFWIVYRGIINVMFDPVGYGVGLLISVISYTHANPWPWYKTQRDWFWDALGDVLGFGGQIIEMRLTDLLTFAQQIPDSVLDAVGLTVGSLADMLNGPLGNPWDWFKTQYPGKLNALNNELIWIGQTLAGNFTATLQAALSGATLLDNAVRHDIGLLFNGITDVVDWTRANAKELSLFLENPVDYIWSRLLPRLYGLTEDWLLSIW